MSQIEEAKEAAKASIRVAARKFAGKPEEFKAEQERISLVLWKKIGKPDLPRTRDKNGSPLSSPTGIMASL